MDGPEQNQFADLKRNIEKVAVAQISIQAQMIALSDIMREMASHMGVDGQRFNEVLEKSMKYREHHILSGLAHDIPQIAALLDDRKIKEVPTEKPPRLFAD